MAQERDVTYARDDEEEQGAGEDDDGERSGDREARRNEIVAGKVLADVPPRALVELGEVEGVQRQRVDRLTWTVSEEDPFPACRDVLVRLVRGGEREDGRYALLNVKKTKKAKSSIRFVESDMWLKKQKWSYEPVLAAEYLRCCLKM